MQHGRKSVKVIIEPSSPDQVSSGVPCYTIRSVVLVRFVLFKESFTTRVMQSTGKARERRYGLINVQLKMILLLIIYFVVMGHTVTLRAG